MRKMNNRGMTIVELLIGFVIVMLIFISLFSIVSTYRDRLQTENYRNELITFQSTLYKAIYDDINNVSNPLTGVTYGETCADSGNTGSLDRVCFKYTDNSEIELALNIPDKQVYYDGKIYDIPDKHYVEFVPIGEATKYFNFTDADYDSKGLFTIDFEIEHLEISNADFGLHIVGSY